MPESTVSESFAKWIIGGLCAATMSLGGWGWQQHQEVQRLKLELALVQVELKGIDKVLTDMGFK
jgi:hypothetical protein